MVVPTIVIAHRLSTVSKADRIYVLASGSIVEEGTHKKLMQKPTPIANNRKIGIVEDEVVQQHCISSISRASIWILKTRTSYFTQSREYEKNVGVYIYVFFSYSYVI